MAPRRNDIADATEAVTAGTGGRGPSDARPDAGEPSGPHTDEAVAAGTAAPGTAEPDASAADTAEPDTSAEDTSEPDNPATDHRGAGTGDDAPSSGTGEVAAG
ncbi:hypothetical protein ACWC19_26480, partial [Streptomyces sp. 900105245]